MSLGWLNHQGGGGSRFNFPLEIFQRGYGNQALASPIWNQDPMRYAWFWEDYLYDALPSDPVSTVYDISASGSPTTGLVADAACGAFQIQLASTSELELVAQTMGNNLYIPGNKPFLFVARVSTVHTMATAQKVLIGLSSDADANDPDNMTRNLWFMQAGSTDLKIEFDDNTNDVDDQDTGKDITAATYYWYVIEQGTNGEIYFRIADGDGSNPKTYTFPSKFNAARPSFGANNLQPFLGVFKSSGTTQPEIKIDAYGFMCQRASS